MQSLNPQNYPLDGRQLIEASAGTGKTYTIALIYLRLVIEKRISVSDILVVTFTIAATEELRDRIRSRLVEAREAFISGESSDPNIQFLLESAPDHDEVVNRLTLELQIIDEAAIFTIHSFCQRVLQQRAFESGLRFDSELVASDSDLVRDIVYDYWRKNLYQMDAGLASLIKSQWSVPSLLYQQVRGLVSKHQLQISLPSVVADEAAFNEVKQEIVHYWLKASDEIIELFADKRLGKAKDTYSKDNVAKAIDAMEWFVGSDQNYAMSEGLKFFSQSFVSNAVTASQRKNGTPEHPVFERVDELLQIIEAKKQQFFYELIGYVQTELRNRKSSRGVISFDDLLIQLHEALHGKQGDHLAAKIAETYPYALIDEFQDTDPLQYQIFNRIYQNSDSTGLHMIGDPKQAIYSFRGADIFTYIGAKAETDPDHSQFTLDTNWRSDKHLIDAVNTIFSTHAAPFVYQGEIDFYPVQSPDDHQPQQLTRDSVPQAAITIWQLKNDPDNVYKKTGKEKPISKELADAQIAVSVAEEIVTLLNDGMRGDCAIGEKAVAAEDIAILVRDRYEAATIEASLSAKGIQSVYYARESIYESSQAFELLTILRAVAEPENETRRRLALTTSLFSYNGNQIYQLQHDERALEDIINRFEQWQQLWLKSGVLVLIRTLIQEGELIANLKGYESYERMLTNFIQLAELLQQAEQRYRTHSELLRWLQQQIASPNGESEEQQLRLESDSDRVRIVTIHKSKGLEYPIVFLPYIWHGSKTSCKELLYHDDSNRLTLDLNNSDTARYLCVKERIAEDIRLLYVAFTRAKNSIYFPWGKINKAEESALFWLLYGNGDYDSLAELKEAFKQHSSTEIKQHLEQIYSLHAVMITEPPAVTDKLLVVEESHGTELISRTSTRAVNQAWGLTSYSAIAQTESSYHPEREKRDSGTAIVTLPKGAEFGTMMHAIFEELDFKTASNLNELVAEKLSFYHFDEQWQGVLTTLFNNALEVELFDSFSLSLLEKDKLISEMEFHFPIVDVDTTEIDKLLNQLWIEKPQRPTLPANHVHGVVRGFIDLTFEYQGQFFIADYKSNYLGDYVDDYQKSALEQSIQEHYYDLQYIVYLLALHRYLKKRKPDYNYDRDIGGALYLFVRGMHKGMDTGVYFNKPEQSLIEQFEVLICGGGQ